MGKMAVILLVGLICILGIVTVSITTRSKDAAQSSANLYNRTNARNVAAGGADYYFRIVKNTPSTRGTFTVNSLYGGTATVIVEDWAPGASDSVRLKSIGVFAGAADTVEALLLQSSSLPAYNAAFSFRCNAPTFGASGTLDIDGRNHDITGSLLPAGPNDRPGVAVINAADISTFVPAYASQINGTSDAVQDPGIPDPSTFVPQLIANADYVMTGSYSSPQTWGSPASPKIVYCSGSVKFSQVCDGWGILIVENFESTNVFTWRGLVIAVADANWKTSNTMRIYGALVYGTAGSSKYNSSGVARIYYSTAGLALADQAAGLGGGALRVAGWMR